MSKSLVNVSNLRRLRWANGRPPHLNSGRNGALQPSAAEAEEIGLALQELDRWQDAFDQNCRGENPDRYHSEIRLAERRLGLAVSGVARGTEAPLPLINTDGST